MTLLGILVLLIFIGVVLYIINLIEMDGRIRNLIYVVVLLFVALYLLQALGLIGALHDVRIR
jgi:hypothetical protein